MSERDLLKAIAEVDCARTAVTAEIVKESTPFMVPWMAAWVAMTCPNHPKYTLKKKSMHTMRRWQNEPLMHIPGNTCFNQARSH